MRPVKLVNLLGKTLRLTGLFKLHEVSNRFMQRGTTPILMYHSISPFNKKLPSIHHKVISATPEMFEKQIVYLNKYYQIISLEDYVLRRSSNMKIPDGCVVLTFDDGYLDNYTYAYPILNAYNTRATIFICPTLIDSQRPLWSNRLARAIYSAPAGNILLFKEQDINMSTVKMRLDTVDKMINNLKSLRPTDQEKMTSRILRALSTGSMTEEPEREYLSWSEIRLMSANGISFGAHTQSHPNLAKIRFSEAKSQIVDSKLRLESELDKPVCSFAYPYGDKGSFNKQIKEMVKDAGYLCGCSTLFGTNRRGEDMFALKRMPIFYCHNMDVFRAKTNGILDIFDVSEKWLKKR